MDSCLLLRIQSQHLSHRLLCERCHSSPRGLQLLQHDSLFHCQQRQTLAFRFKHERFKPQGAFGRRQVLDRKHQAGHLPLAAIDQRNQLCARLGAQAKTHGTLVLDGDRKGSDKRLVRGIGH